jgi:predicted O-linked N-acetylglucosamine transferase (SPINDLY family)
VDRFDIDQIVQPPTAAWEARRDLARVWLEMPAEQVAIRFSGLGAAHWAMVQSSLRQFPPSDADGPIRNVILNRLSEEAPSPGVLLAGMLFFFPHEWPQFWELDEIPGWLIGHYLAYMLQTPAVLHGHGQAEKLVRFMEDWFGYLLRQIETNPCSKAWQDVARYAVCTQFLKSYFTMANLRKLMTTRARILEYALAAEGSVLDFQFSPAGRSGRLRVGVLAIHFGPSPETRATLPAYLYLDRGRFELILLSILETKHPVEKFCAAQANRFMVLPPELAQRVSAIRALDLDILLIGTNVTAANNDITDLAVHRLARVQVAGISSCVTTGMRNVDWHLSGTYVEPIQEVQSHYTERLLLIDGTGHCYDFAGEAAGAQGPPPSREELGIPKDAIVFVSGANGYKVIPELQDVWTQILAAVPHSRLLLHPVNPYWGFQQAVQAFLQRMKQALARHGVEAQRLLAFEPTPTRQQTIQRSRLADIYLDSFPYSGASTLLDGLLLGLPPVVMNGCHFRSLMGAGFMRELQMQELIADNAQSYIQLAVKLATDATYRASIGQRISTAMSAGPRFLDARDYARQIGDALVRAWEARENG